MIETIVNKLLELLFKYAPEFIARRASPIVPQPILLVHELRRDRQTQELHLRRLVGRGFVVPEFPAVITFGAVSQGLFRNRERTDFQHRLKLVDPDGADFQLGDWHSSAEFVGWPVVLALKSFNDVTFERPGKYQVVHEVKEGNSIRKLSVLYFRVLLDSPRSK